MTGDNSQYHNYNIGKIGYNEFNSSATDHSGEIVSLDSLLKESEEATEEQEEMNPSGAWLMSGINKTKIKSR